MYNRFIKPISTDSDQAAREIVVNYLLMGVLALSVVAFVATFLEPLILTHEPSHPFRLLANFVTILFVVALYCVARYRHAYKVTAITLTGLVTLFGCFVALQWGMLDPDSVLLLSLSVVMAGILISARSSLYVTGILVVVLIYLQHGESSGSLHPDLSWLGSKPVPGDVVAFSALLCVIALVSWLFNRQMERSLQRARRSEQALQRQKDLLEMKVQKRTQQLEAARLEQMQELYRFAELGRLSTALFHDLANNLTNISIDIEGLHNKDQSDLIMQRLHGNVRHIDSVVQRVRQQMQGKTSIETFNVLAEINEVLSILSFDASQAGVSVSLELGSVRPSLLYRGDVTRFRQLLLNLIANAIEAYGSPRHKRGTAQAGHERTVLIKLERIKTALTISVTDYGRVIPAQRLEKIFEPFYTTKSKGVGIGLFIVKQVVENHFKGNITVRSDKQHGTTFSATLPKSYYAKSTRA
ncbi:MAG TPA: HAMP domain-containing sensor histidine kinase [Candidatus Saccharimonadales bacterium]|nr:HAMP domain-containing sensor histidine kinase [Candidatus Saccharimonadales bacterium]